MANSVYGAALAFYLGVQYHEVLESLLNVLFVAAQTALLLLDLLLEFLTLTL